MRPSNIRTVTSIRPLINVKGIQRMNIGTSNFNRFFPSMYDKPSTFFVTGIGKLFRRVSVLVSVCLLSHGLSPVEQ